MITKKIQVTPFHEITLRVPEHSDIVALAEGDLAPDVFGGLSKVRRIAYKGQSKTGQHFVGYTTDLAKKGGGQISMSMIEGQLICDLETCKHFTRTELDKFEANLAVLVSRVPDEPKAVEIEEPTGNKTGRVGVPVSPVAVPVVIETPSPTAQAPAIAVVEIASEAPTVPVEAPAVPVEAPAVPVEASK